MRSSGQPFGFASVLQWRLGQPKARILLGGLFLMLCLMGGFSIGAAVSGRPFGDFAAMWRFGRFSLGHPAAQLYDLDRLSAFQRTAAPGAGQSPYAYPPFYLLFLQPFALLPLGLGWALWSAGGYCAYLAAVFAGRWRSRMLPFVALAPASVVALICGQNGLFSAALIIGGLRLVVLRPLLAGVLFGAAAFKPQLGLLIPLALLAARAWRCLAAAGAAIAGLSLAATAMLGPTIWAAWIAALHRQWIGYVAEGNATRAKMPTLAAGLEQAGVPTAVALSVQAVSFAAAAVVVWIVFRRRTDRWAVAMLLVACLVATPYALLYDLPVLTFAVVLAVAEAERTDAAWSAAEVLVLLAAYLAPYALFLIGGPSAPLAAAAILALFVVLARRALARQRLDEGGAQA